MTPAFLFVVFRSDHIYKYSGGLYIDPCKHIHIFYSAALATSRRDLDAPKRAPENLDPKTRMLGVAPMVFCKVEPPKTP